MNHFCTYCDQGYAARLLCLHDSLAGHGEAFRLYVLCFDAETEAVVTQAGRPALVPVPLAELVAADPDYAAVRAQRSPVEFFFTTTPVLVRHCLRREATAERMTYLDADLFFFGPASGVLAEQGDAAVGIVPHRFPPRLADRLIYGTYNVAWVSFRRSSDGLACLDWWRERCLEWCHDRVDQGRFADQGYLDEFPKRFAGVRVLDHPGINAAPWNVDGASVTRRDGAVQIDGRPLWFFHFQGVRQVARGWFEPGLRAYGTAITSALRTLVYEPYLGRLVAVERELAARQAFAPRLVHHRLNTGATARERWERGKARWVLPYYGRLNGRLVRGRPRPANGTTKERAVVLARPASFQLLVVTPTLGTSPWLDETVASVARQAVDCRHVLVAPANAVGALRARFPRVSVLAEPGGGMYAAINAGLAGGGDWDACTYINDDDLLLADFARVAVLARTTEARIVYGGVRLIDTNGRRIGAIPISPWPRFNRLLYGQRVEPVYQHGTVATRAVVTRLGPFDDSLRFCGDSEFLGRACVAGVPFVFATREPVAAFRLRAGQLTKNLPAMLAEHHRVYDKLQLAAPRRTLRHRAARFAFLVANVPVYLERISRHGFITFGEQLARGE